MHVEMLDTYMYDVGIIELIHTLGVFGMVILAKAALLLISVC